MDDPPEIFRGTGDRSTLQNFVRAHLPGFLTEFQDEHGGRPLPQYVIKEFEALLECGDPAFGFARISCPSCATDMILPFSCKGRTFCSSCGGRQMAQTAAHLVVRRDENSQHSRGGCWLEVVVEGTNGADRKGRAAGAEPAEEPEWQLVRCRVAVEEAARRKSSLRVRWWGCRHPAWTSYPFESSEPPTFLMGRTSGDTSAPTSMSWWSVSRNRIRRFHR